MIIAALTFGSLLHSCAPNVGARTMAAIVRVESGGNALAIHDNTIDRSFAPVDLTEAVAWSRQLLAMRHSVDLGISQINSANLPRLGMSIREAFDPCTNLRGGATILSADYRQAATQFGPGQFALRRAIGAYNSGSLYAGYSYIARILAAAGLSAEDDFHVPDIASLGGSSAGGVVPASRIAAPAPAPAPVRVVHRPSPPRYRLVAAPRVDSAPQASPILVQVVHVDAAARQRAIAAAAGTPVVRGAAAGDNAVVLQRTSADAVKTPAPSGAVLVVAPKP